MFRLPHVFRPREKGIRQVLGDLEAQVLETLWERHPVSGKEVHRRIAHPARGRRKARLALTSILTVLSRLMEKGLVAREKSGGVYLYRPAVSREALMEAVARSVLSGLIESNGVLAATSFVECLEHDHPRLLERVRRLLEERRAGGGEVGSRS